MLVSLEFRQPQFFTDLVVANAQLLNLLVRHVYLLTRLEVHTVDDTVRVNVFAVSVCADQNFTALEVSGEPACCFVCCARVDVCTFWKTLYHVVKHHATFLMVQQFRTQELVERGFRLAANAADEILAIPERFSGLRDVAHHAFHAAARLRTLFVVHEVDDCDFVAPPSCNSRRAVLILENSCTAESKLANCTLPIFASTASWLRLLPMAFCCRRTSFSPSRMMIFLPRQQLIT